MIYMGSKKRLQKYIAPILNKLIKDNEIINYVEPFVGGANMIEAIECKYKVGYDNNKYLISLLNYVVINGLEGLPKIITRDFYSAVRDSYNKEDGGYEDYLIGYVGFMASYNGRFFDGGYSGHAIMVKGKTKPRDYIAKTIENLQRQILSIKNIDFIYSDYTQINVSDSVIYCDPPYRGTKKYTTSKKFNHEEFYDWCRKMSKRNIVVVSEYEMPKDFTLLWQKTLKTNLHDTLSNSGKKDKTERLFIMDNRKNKKEYIKSPLNYVGGKFKLLPQILPLFPNNIRYFVDLFCGGGNVGVNISSEKKIMNDIEPHVINFMKSIKGLNGVEANKSIEDIIKKYNLSKINQDGFLKLRNDYNRILDNGFNWEYFYSVVSHAFNYQIRYNKEGKYNMPFGKDRSWYNPKLKEKFIRFVDSIDDSFLFTNLDFSEFLKKNYKKLNSNDFVYCDPPYLITTASYNESDGWNEKLEVKLLRNLDKLNGLGIKFGLSNVFYHKGKSNDILIEWSKKYNVHYLDKNYNNSSYQGKDTNKKTVEVYICNY